eukprot:NODE_6281_length_461_cov_180.398058_g4764_i0.p2 GENE.NODE_6281_length_461_cov_180.398058_g4764_i0~~NODE_6281_length_461_cov_180.398058_g4764_i0.p2  ORF type:complete len:131 (-),score=58.11 NODE_6281_length_461_cov_180.398058_g4764_i0:67-429(-)
MGRLTLLELHTLPFGKQIRAVRSTNILLGAHGAGLAHLLWLPLEAVVVEIFPVGFQKAVFRNLAKLTNKAYIGVQQPGVMSENWAEAPLNVTKSAFVRAVTNAVRLARNFDTAFEGRVLR